MKKKAYDVIVIGAGAAGLMTAYVAAARGRSVLVIEKSNKAGKKILMSGGGRCNFTNLDVQAENYLSHNPHFVISALQRYTQWDFIALVEQYQIEYAERKHGQLFCRDSAKDIVRLLLDQCQQYGVEIQLNTAIQQVRLQNESEQNTIFELDCGDEINQCQSLVVASGGLSVPTLGGSGMGYQLAEQFGHRVYPTSAGLVPFIFSDHLKAMCERLSGISVDVQISNQRAGFNESLLFTHRGMSGPCVLQQSNYWQTGESVDIDFSPNDDLFSYLIEKKKQQPKSLLRTVLHQFWPKNLVLEMEALLWKDMAQKALTDWADRQLQQVADRLHCFKVKPSATEGFRTAEVTLGGVDTTEVSSKTMQSTKQKGLFFVGEVLDVTGHLGGYNFQWAWSSAQAAGQFV